MAEEYTDQMKAFMLLTDAYVHSGEEAEPLVEAVVEEASVLNEAAETRRLIFEDLNDLIFKLRSYQDTEAGDYAAGVEAGMAQASEMIENVIRKFTDRGEEQLG